jgi:hypothetical protein
MLGRRSEAQIQAAIVRALSQLGFLVIHVPNQATRGRQRYSGLLPGAPDLIVIGKGRVWFLEIKKPGGKQSQAQIIVQRLIEDRGFGYYVVRSVEDALNVVGYGSQKVKSPASRSDGE